MHRGAKVGRYEIDPQPGPLILFVEDDVQAPENERKRFAIEANRVGITTFSHLVPGAFSWNFYRILTA